MINLKDRNSYILKALIKEYTRTGEPVASEILNIKYRLGVSSATIRNDFVILTEEGYLYKPYISSGRIPTDKAWKFFIDTIFEDENDSLEQWKEKLKNQVSKIKPRPKENVNFIKEIKKLLDVVSEESHSFCFCYLFEEDEIIKQGLKYMFAEMLEEKLLTCSFFQQIAESLERLDEKLKNIKIDENPLILIGKENPFVQSDQFSSLLSVVSRPRAILGILGPKRMRYKRNIAILRAITNLTS
jgi:transcriptional regulator of heat shock response